MVEEIAPLAAKHISEEMVKEEQYMYLAKMKKDEIREKNNDGFFIGKNKGF